jgi:hypothetical protein
MAQDPLKVDQLQIEPNADGTRLINRATDGSLKFTDAVITGGLLLKQLAGLRNIANFLVVGKSGAGAAYTTIQSALDAIPAGASPTNPYIVLVGPGVYAETLNIARDGVTIIGFGAVLAAVELVADGPAAYHTMVIQAALGTIPTKVTLINLEIGNIHQNYACVRIVGGAASTVGSNGIQLINCILRATSVGGNRPIWATSVNHITMEGGSMQGATTSLTVVEECSTLLLKDVATLSALQLDYDSTGTLPSDAVVGYKLANCTDVARLSALVPKLSSTLSGGCPLTLSGVTGDPTLSLAGDQAITVVGSCLGTITLAGSVALSLTGSKRGAVTPGGTATLAEPVQRGTTALVAADSIAVVFPVPHPNANYSLTYELQGAPANNNPPYTDAKSAAGFTVHFASAQTMDVQWAAHRVM